MQGRYELIWIVGLITLLAALIADRFTVAGLGQDFSVNVGLNYRQIQLTGMAMIAIASGVVIVVVGVLPFLGLVVPNIVSMIFGDNCAAPCLGRDDRCHTGFELRYPGAADYLSL